MRRTFCLLLIFALAGCAQPLTKNERLLLTGIMQSIEPLREEHRELGKWSKNIERGRDFVSYSRDLSDANSTPLMNPSYFWFKISLAERAIDPSDLQPPILTVFMPQYKKYLKLRIVTSNAPLATEIARIVYQRAVEMGGTDVRWGTGGAQGPTRMRGRRTF